MTRKDELEIEYWKSAISKDFSVRYKKALELFGVNSIDYMGEVMDWGCGPFFGILPYLNSNWKEAVDPLWDQYFQRFGNVLDKFGEDTLCFTIDDFSPGEDDPIDTIFTINSIDHGNSDFSVLNTFHKLLKPGGKVYLHVHLRTPEQLNDGHDHCLTYEDYLKNKEGLFEVIKETIYDRDPLPIEDNEAVTDRYKTLITVLKKI